MKCIDSEGLNHFSGTTAKEDNNNKNTLAAVQQTYTFMLSLLKCNL